MNRDDGKSWSAQLMAIVLPIFALSVGAHALVTLVNTRALELPFGYSNQSDLCKKQS
ncbi:MAG: hypothetical protein ACYDHP_02570 [Ferrimicrobium sp.]